MKKSFYALFIGINGYQPKVANPLYGCINDVLASSDFFQKLFDAQEEKINWDFKYLLAPSGKKEAKMLKSRNITYEEPTRDNIIKAFDHFKKADPKAGDYCLLFYSGHGATLNAVELDVFSKYEPSGELQTIVCGDKKRQDILDKELGYLIANALEGKELNTDKENEGDPGVHFLAIFDCCHSGTISRKLNNKTGTRRARSATRASLPEEILGFTKKGNCFYEAFKPGQKSVLRNPDGLKHARYVNLSASRDNEDAKEIAFNLLQADEIGEENWVLRSHGVFTHSLLNILKRGGTHVSYGRLMQSVESEVQKWSTDQIPVIGKTGLKDENLFFLNSEFSTPQPDYVVNWRETFDGIEWFLKAGKIEGIEPSKGKAKSTVRLSKAPESKEREDERIFEIKEVGTTESVLDGSLFTDEDQKNSPLRATIHSMAFPKIRVGLNNRISDDLKAEIIEAWENDKDNFHYFELESNSDIPTQFEIISTKERIVDQLIDKNQAETIEEETLSDVLLLVSYGSDVPLFPESTRVESFLSDVNKVGKWESTKGLTNPDSSTQIPREDLQIEVYILEGKHLTNDVLEEFAQKGSEKKSIDHEQINVSYINECQPAIKVKISNLSDTERYWVGALYLSSTFGINSSLMEIKELGYETIRSSNLKYTYSNKEIEAIASKFDPFYHEYGVTDIQANLIFIVSKQKFDLKKRYY